MLVRKASLCSTVACIVATGCGRADSSSADRIPVSRSTSQPKVEWVDPNQVQPGPIQRDSLTSEQIARIRKLQAVFAEVDGQPVEKWIDDFKRDLNPDRELDIWETMAKAYTAYCSKHTLSPEAKKEVFRIVLLRSGAPEKEVLDHLDLKVLTNDDAIAVMREF